MAVTDEFKLNSQNIIQLLADPAFYAACPVYLYLEESATARHREYIQELARRDPRTCGGCADRSQDIISPAVAEFVRQTCRLHRRGAELLRPLRNYLCKKLGYQPQSFSLYYTENGKQQSLMF